MKKIIIIGAGGHAAVVVDIIESMKSQGHQIKVIGLLDDREDTNDFMGYKILDKIKNAPLYNDENTEFVIAIGNNHVREKISIQLDDLKYFTPIHLTAIIGSNTEIQEGTVVMPRAIINANTKIGKHVIINSGSIVEHDNIIEDYAHISPGATLCGGVTIGRNTHIGANSTVIPCTTIGSETVIGAGSTVITDIQSEVMAVGSPAKVIRKIR